jgi:HAD superfamily hydrolase (TIGR01509 family)
MTPAPFSSPPQLVIFDCDGVLIDSEYLAAKAQSVTLKKYGVEISAEDFMHRYAGYTDVALWAMLSEQHGVIFPPEMLALHDIGVTALFRAELEALSGAAALVASIKARGIPVCIASNSRPERLEFSLRLAGLWDDFAPHVFSAVRVAHSKPAPDIYIYAARQFGIAPQHCLVIEDSIAGVTAAHRAGMQVAGFTGARHCLPGHGEVLRRTGAAWDFDHLDKLRLWLESSSLGTPVAALVPGDE